MDSAVIAVENLTKYYGRSRGVESLSFAVEPGEIFGFIGPNGAGKTTTIRILLDLVRPTSGTVRLLGLPVSKNSIEIRKRCGYLPGDFSPYGHFTAGEFLTFALRLRGGRGAPDRALLDRFGFARGELGRKIKHLSHGTRRKLGIVQAFFHDPELVILDEPSIGLDPLMQEEFYSLLLERKREGRTVFLSSHILSEVERLCDRAAVVRSGNLVTVEALVVLKRRRSRRLRIRLRHPVEGVRLAGAELVRSTGCQYEFLVRSDPSDFLPALAQLPVEDFVFAEPDLEEVFLAYYRNE
jgi:ABC-2 type transport system ATP-binding protein